MRSAVWFFIISMLFIPGVATGGVDGKELLQKCEPIEKLYEDPSSLSSKEASGVVYCLGYIDSFVETFYFQTQAKILPSLPYCMPESKVPKKEVAKRVVDYLKNHSEELAKPAGYYIFMALREAYPCNKEENDGKEETKINENKITVEQ